MKHAFLDATTPPMVQRKGGGSMLNGEKKKKGVIMEQNCVLPPVGERGHKHRVRVIQGGGGGVEGGVSYSMKTQ